VFSLNTNNTPTTIYRRRWWTLVTIAISVLVVGLDALIVNIALPTLQRDLGATISDLQWIVSIYTMIFAGLMLTTGALGDRIGRARILQAGILLFAGASLGASFAHSAAVLIIWRAVMGIGGAMILPATLAIVTNTFPKEERGKAIGIWAGINGVSIALGPIIGGLVIENLSWHWIFYINIPVAVVALTLGWFFVPNSRDSNPKPLDVPGTLLSTSGLAALVFGLIKSNDRGWSDPVVIGTLCGSVALIILFILWERHTMLPMLDMSLFRNRRFSAGVFSIVLMGLALFSLSFCNTLFMQFVKGYSPLQTGVRYIPLALGVLVGAGGADRIVQRIGTAKVMFIGFLGTAALSIIFSFWGADVPYWQIGLVYGGLGFFLGYITAPAATAIMEALPEARAGVGSAVNSVFRMVSGSVAVAVFGTVLSNIYTSSFNKAIAGIPNLPAEVVKPASDSVGAAVTIAEKLPAQAGQMLSMIAKNSFMDGWQVMALITCGMCILGGIFVFGFMPAQRGSGKNETAIVKQQVKAS
jgi:EmrB/QacA subfamily drug resistance transporter